MHSTITACSHQAVNVDIIMTIIETNKEDEVVGLDDQLITSLNILTECQTLF